VYDRSSGTGSNGWDTLAKKWNKPLFTASSSHSSSGESNHSVYEMQKAVYRAVHWWRESVSREEDESTRYVLPNQYLFRIAETPPGDLGNLLRLFGNSVPVVVKRRAKELLDVVRDVVKSSLGGGGGGEAKKHVENEKEEGVNKDEDEKVEQVGKLKGVKDSSGGTNEKLWGQLSKFSSFSISVYLTIS
jgi:exosome complex exonuclease RRP6